MAIEKSPGDERSFRPRLGGRGGQVPFQRAPRFCPSVIARAQVRFQKTARFARSRPPRKGGTRCVADVLRPGIGSRRCIVKARIVQMNGRGMKAARLHLAYIERDGVERDGSAGRLYGADEIVERAGLVDAIPGERHQFRFIVSPEDDVDLTQFTRDLMRNVERDIGLRLEWGAVNHYNTDNPHVHVVVRGVDRDGHEVWIDRAYISERMRWRAQHILTDELGQRPRHEIDRQLDREIGQVRPTSIDRGLARVLEPDHTIDLARLSKVADEPERRRLVGRLQTLETLKLAERTARGAWRLDPGWQTALRELGERQEVINRLRTVMGDAGNPELFEIIDARSERAPIEGVLRKKGLHDELRGGGYAVVETQRGQAAYVRLDLVTADKLVEGSMVRVAVETQKWSKPMDRVLQQVARESGGVYDARAHLEALRRRPLEVGGKTVAPEEVVAANVRRLERLERHQLVTKVADGRWQVPTDLVRMLEARDASHPRRLVRAETVAPRLERQLTMRAPCWLDGQDASAPRVYYGFGSELRSAIAEREKFLRGLGIEPEPRERRLQALRQLERHDLGRKLAADQGVKALPAPVPGMRGRMFACGQDSSGTPLVYVLDQVNQRLAVMPAPRDAATLIGRQVTVGRDANGRFVTRADGLGRGL
jgi:type IV secretory pathway VirD2 relaxase